MAESKETIICKRCGTEVGSDIGICPKCGEKLKEGYYGTTWLSIYTVLFVIQIIGSVLSTASTAMACAEYNLFSDVVGLSTLALVTVEMVYRIFTFIHFSRRTALGYTLNMVYIFLDVFISAINTSFNRSMDANTNIGHVWGILIASAVLLLVWSLPNYIYFKHRKFLFEGNLTKNNTSSNEKAIMNKVEPSIVISSENQGVDNQTTNSMNRPKSAEKPVIDSIHMSKTKNSESAIPVEDLRALKELYDSGIVTKEEFEEKKAQLLEL